MKDYSSRAWHPVSPWHGTPFVIMGSNFPAYAYPVGGCSRR